MKKILTLVVTLFFAVSTPSIFADDLYQIQINSQNDADQLKALLPQTIVRTLDGYLVLLDQLNSERISHTTLNYELLKNEIDAKSLALDRRGDDLNSLKYPLLYQSGDLRLLEADLTSLKAGAIPTDLLSLADKNIPVGYYPQKFQMIEPLNSIQLPLDSLAALVLQDDLTFDISYVQKNISRLPASASNERFRNWIINRFNMIGLDSVYIDTFYVDIYGVPTLCQNVIAVKNGSTNPEYQIIVGAHYDSVDGSPGADDNGSGTIAVLKIAEILGDAETDMTFKFILFDAEEEGLHGSYHHAELVHQNQDSLVLMFNMDMIGAAGNENDANVYHGTYTDHAEVFEYLADSLLDGFNAPPSGHSGSSDHVPYFELGYNVIDLMEYNFSTVYHTSSDNINYMNMAYMTKMVKGALMTVYAISQTYGPIPEFQFSDPDGQLTNINPLVPTKYQVQLTSTYGAEYVPGSARFNYHLMGDPTVYSLPATDLGNNLIKFEPPILDCYQEIGYYISVDEVQTGQLNYPSDIYRHAIVADSTLYPFADNFTDDLGWVATAEGAVTALFERGQLPGYAMGWYYPPSDINGDGYCFITGNYEGASYATKGTRSITSPVLQMPGDAGYIKFYYFFNSYYDLDNDYLDVLVNNGDGNWVKVAEFRQPDPYYYWAAAEVSFEEIQSHGVEITPTMQIRFSAVCGPLNTMLECCIDDIRIVSYFCDQYFVHADPSTRMGEPPMEVTFTSQCDFNVSSWLWDFGDGGSSTAEHPTHIYTEPGTYSVRVDVQTNEGDYYSVHDQIVGVYADTMATESINGAPGAIVEMEVYARNYIPLNEIILPLKYSGSLGLTFKGFSNEGLRSSNMTAEYLDFNSFYKEITISMTAPEDIPLSPGNGPILKLLFELSGSATLDDSTQIKLETIDSWQPQFNSILGDYNPELNLGYIKAGSCCLGIRGNIDSDAENIIDVSDLVYFVDYQFRNGDAPACLEEADLVIDSQIDVADLVFMVDYQFRNGEPPPSCF